MYTLNGYGSPSGKPSRQPKGQVSKSTVDLDNPDDVERLIKAINRGEALTSPMPKSARPQHFQPLFKHPLPISDHSAYHEANLRRVTCCRLEKQAGAAVTLGDAWVLEEVFINGARVDIPDKNGFSPIHIAVKVNSFECVMALINMKVDVNAVTLTGVTPLFLAQSIASKEIQKALIEEGGLVAVVNHDEVPPIEFLEVGGARDQSLLDSIDRDGRVPPRYSQF